MGASTLPLQATAASAVIRRATADDLAGCAAIINDYIDATDWLPRLQSHEQMAGLFTPELLNTKEIWLAETDGETAGYLSMSADGMVRAIYLARNFRGHGIGKRLLDHAKEQHPDRLELNVFESNLDARRFYEREGFREVPERREEETEEGVPVLLMRWRGAK